MQGPASGTLNDGMTEEMPSDRADMSSEVLQHCNAQTEADR
ncbi:hypothetical protein [Haloplanus sp.]|nr:hypothetical protein [Haloplanus sp.]